MDQHRGNRAINSAREPADHSPLPDLLADSGDLGIAEARHCPLARAAAYVPHEIAEQLATVGRVHDLGMEHQTIALRFLVGGDGKRRPFRARDHLEVRSERLHPVAVAHPDLVFFAYVP